MKDPHKHKWSIMEFDGGWFEYCTECHIPRMADGLPQECPECQTRRRVYGNTIRAIECPTCGTTFPVSVKPYLERRREE